MRKGKINMELRRYSNKRIITRITAVLLVVSMLMVFGCGKTKETDSSEQTSKQEETTMVAGNETISSATSGDESSGGTHASETVSESNIDKGTLAETNGQTQSETEKATEKATEKPTSKPVETQVPTVKPQETQTQTSAPKVYGKNGVILEELVLISTTGVKVNLPKTKTELMQASQGSETRVWVVAVREGMPDISYEPMQNGLRLEKSKVTDLVGRYGQPLYKYKSKYGDVYVYRYGNYVQDKNEAIYIKFFFDDTVGSTWIQASFGNVIGLELEGKV